MRNLRLIITWYINLNFALLAYIVAWFDRRFKFSLPFPRDTDDLANKKDWCVAELKKSGALPQNAVVNSYRVIPLKQETIFSSNIGIVEIVYSDGDEKNFRCIAKFAPTAGTLWNRTVFNMQLNHIKEINFNKYFVAADKQIPAPQVYYAGVAVFTGNLCLLMELMSDDREYTEDEVRNIRDSDLNLVLDGLTTLHATYWKDTSMRMKNIYPITEGTVDFFDSLVVGKWSIPARKILVNSWNRMNQLETVIHGDARIGNMMFPATDGKGRFVFIDWQAVRRGKGMLDLAYFTVLSLTPARRQSVEQYCIATYWQLLQNKGVNDYTGEELKEDYQHACLCVLVLLSLPMLSGEASAEGAGAQIFAYGMNIWRERLQAKFAEFDYTWLASNYGITPQEGRNAVSEMLNIIDQRLKAIKSGAAV